MQTWPAPAVPLLPGTGLPVLVRDRDGALVPSAEGPVARLYVCGITPYDATHLGHAATAVAFDLLHRAWLDQGLEVRHASNVTDVDDPLLERAAATGEDWRALAARQIALYADDMTALAVLPPTGYVGAVESVPLVQDAVRRMVAAGTAYRVPLEPGAGGDRPDLGDLYADASAQGLDELLGMDREAALATFAERGGDPAREGKRDALDPLLWRRVRPGEPSWPAEDLGEGRPGWHIECAVIAERELGPDFDVVGGGSDLCFPHHAMSTAHARALGGSGARVSMHAGMVALDGEKMSKSLGNLVLVSRLREQGVDPMAIRLAILAHHYAADWEWTDEVLATGVARLARWRAAVSGNGGPAVDGVLAEVRAALADDLDAPRALEAVDAWASASLTLGGDELGAPGVVARAVDALLGVRL